MENLEGICSRIGLQEEVREKISEIEANYPGQKRKSLLLPRKKTGRKQERN